MPRAGTLRSRPKDRTVAGALACCSSFYAFHQQQCTQRSANEIISRQSADHHSHFACMDTLRQVLQVICNTKKRVFQFFCILLQCVVSCVREQQGHSNIVNRNANKQLDFIVWKMLLLKWPSDVSQSPLTCDIIEELEWNICHLCVIPSLHHCTT